MNINEFDAPIALVWFVFVLVGVALVNIGFQAFRQTLAAIQPKRKQTSPLSEISQKNSSERLACSLMVRQAKTADDCCLFQSRTGNPLLGGARTARQFRLKRLGMLL